MSSSLPPHRTRPQEKLAPEVEASQKAYAESLEHIEAAGGWDAVVAAAEAAGEAPPEAPAPPLASLVNVAAVVDLSTEKSDALVRLAVAMAPNATIQSALETADPLERATKLVEWAGEMGIPCLTQPDDLRDSNPRLILPFVMSMFAWHHAHKDDAAAPAAAGAADAAAAAIKQVWVVRQHWHVPAPADGSAAGTFTSTTVCAFKAEADVLRYVLGENITLVGTDPDLPHLTTMMAAYAAAAGFTEESVVESLGPLPGLLDKPEDVEVDDAEKLRARVEAWVRGLPTVELKHYSDLLAAVLQVGPAVKLYAADRAQVF